MSTAPVNKKNFEGGENTKMESHEKYADLPFSNVNPQILREHFFNGISGPKLNLTAIYRLFQRKDATSLRIGRKWFWETKLFLEWWEKQAGKK